MSDSNTNSVASPSSPTSFFDQWKRLRSEQQHRPKGGKKKTGTGGAPSEPRSSGSTYMSQNQPPLASSDQPKKHGHKPSRQRAPKYYLQWTGYGDLEPSGCPPWFIG